MSDPALSDQADPLYRPLADLGVWAGVVPREGGWAAAVGRIEDLRLSHPAWADMVLRGARLAAAHQSGALDGVHGGGLDVAMALVRALDPAAVAGPDAWPHVRANDAALRVAAAATAVTEDVVRRVHEAACAPQLAHRVEVDGRIQDHVLAHGDYKHHPNHVRAAGGGWRARAPVARVGPEMRAFVDALAGARLSRLHPAARAAYALHGLTHVAPFADGNGRIARALAGAYLLQAADIPLLVVAEDAAAYDDVLAAAGEGDVVDLVHFVLDRSVDLAGVVTTLEVPPEGSHDPALERWRGRVEAARSLGGELPAAVGRALERHRARTDLGWLSSLADARVVAPGPSSHEERFDAGPLRIVVPLPGGLTVEELIAVDAHPLDAHPLDGDPRDDDGGGRVVARARDAQLRLEAWVGQPRSESSARLRPWLDRVVSTLALRVAAELE